MFDLDRLDDTDPFEIDRQAAHIFKHHPFGIGDIYEIWNSDPLFYPAKPPAHWLMVAEIAGQVVVVPLAPSDHDDPTNPVSTGCLVLVTIWRKSVGGAGLAGGTVLFRAELAYAQSPRHERA